MKKKNKLLTIMLAGAMVLYLLPTSFSSIAMAGEETPISNIDQLKDVKGSGNYRLTTDIDLSGADWKPLGEFSGTLDGGDHVIRNLSITDTTESTGNDKGLFASISEGGKVKNLGIEGANITAGKNSGSIAGTNNGTISRCYTTGTVSGTENVGGIVGINAGIIENCYSRVSVSGKDYLGGLAGCNSGTIKTSYAASAVTDSVMNNYLEFKGNGYIEIPHKGEYSGDAFTLEAWFQWDNVDTDDINFIIGKGYEQFEIHTGGGSGKNGLRFIPVPHGANTAYENRGGYEGDSWIDVQNVLQTGWFHVAAVYWYDSDKGEAYAKVYVNGEAQELWQKPPAEGAAVSTGETATLSRSSNPLASSTNPINIGRRTQENYYYFNGKIADVRFWNSARTEEQIKENKDKVLTVSETNLVGYWKLNEKSGTEAIDSSNTKNNGTMTNVTRVTASDTTLNRGALTGSNTATITNCFFDSTLYGTESGGVGTAKTTADMKNQPTYTGWDFATIWKMSDGDYPNLGFKKVNSVTVSPETASVVKGGNKTFTATVTGENSPAQTVNWTVEGGSGTTIDPRGNLTVAAGETATELTIKATSTEDTTKSGTATVTVTEESSTPGGGTTPTEPPSTPGGGTTPTEPPSTPGGGTTPTEPTSTPGGGTTPTEPPSTPGGSTTPTEPPSTQGEDTTPTELPSTPDDGDDHTAPTEETVYNDPSIPQATVWLAGKGLDVKDRLITERQASGERYNAILRLTDGDQVFRAYNIYLQSGRKSTGNAMYITFDLSAKYAEQAFTLVHEMDNMTYEYFYATAESNGHLTFGPLYSLSPFVLVKGTLSQTPADDVTDIPKTGDRSIPALWIWIMLMAGTALASGYAIMKKKGF